MWQRYLIDPLRGRTSLWRVIWLYGFVVSIAYSLLAPLFPSTRAGLGTYVAGGVAIGIVQSVMLWQCAFNSRYPRYGHWLRAMVVIGALAMLVVLYVAWSHPELADLVT